MEWTLKMIGGYIKYTNSQNKKKELNHIIRKSLLFIRHPN